MFEFHQKMPLARWNGSFFAGRPYDSRFVNYVRNAGHTSVEGWVMEGALSIMLVSDQLQRAAGRVGHVAEIGVHHGRFFIANALTNRGKERAFAIDVFEDQHLNIDRSGSGDRAIFERHLVTQQLDTNLIDILKGDSLKLKKSGFPKDYVGNIRLFSVDGGHTIRHVLSDMALAASVIDDYGVVIVDDFFNQLWPDVTQGTFEYLAKNNDLAPFAYGDNKLFLCKPKNHGYFMKGMEIILAHISANPKEVVLGGSPCYHINAVAPGNLLPTPDYSIGTRLITSAAGTGQMYFGAGWCDVEPWGTWTIGQSSFVFLPITPGKQKQPLKLSLRGHASLKTDNKNRTAKVFVNDKDVGTISFGAQAQQAVINIPNLGEVDELKIEIRMDEVFSPLSAKVGADDRRLGFAIYEMLVSD